MDLKGGKETELAQYVHLELISLPEKWIMLPAKWLLADKLFWI